MATAFAKGVMEANLCRSDQILASDIEEFQRKNFEKETGASAALSNNDVVAFSDLVILAVKPNHANEVLGDIRKSLGEKPLISIAAGISLSTLAARLEEGARLVRVMPNTPVLVRAGASVYATGPNVSQDDLHLVKALLDAVGISFHLPEKMLDAVTGLSGSGPAYIFLILEALSDGGVAMGLPRDISLKLAIQTVLGAAKLARETGKHPGELKDMVTSPGGTTIDGLHVLEDHKVHAAFMNAICVATEKSRKLGESK